MSPTEERAPKYKTELSQAQRRPCMWWILLRTMVAKGGGSTTLLGYIIAPLTCTVFSAVTSCVVAWLLEEEPIWPALWVLRAAEA